MDSRPSQSTDGKKPTTVPANVTIIGIDCATQAKNVGLARGRLIDGLLHVDDVCLGTMVESVAATILAWLGPRCLLAMDAPLGWPAPLGEALAQHQAGAPLTPSPAAMFNRHTDRLVHQRVGKKPLEVGADRIARTAHAALSLLAEIGELRSAPIPLCWEPDASEVCAIEVYPAATLLSRGCVLRGYKRRDEEGRSARRAILERIGGEARWAIQHELLLASDDALDAAICLFAGADFLNGLALAPEPEEMGLARSEGWIWVRAANPNGG